MILFFMLIVMKFRNANGEHCNFEFAIITVRDNYRFALLLNHLLLEKRLLDCLLYISTDDKLAD